MPQSIAALAQTDAMEGSTFAADAYVRPGVRLAAYEADANGVEPTGPRGMAIGGGMGGGYGYGSA